MTSSGTCCCCSSGVTAVSRARRRDPHVRAPARHARASSRTSCSARCASCSGSSAARRAAYEAARPRDGAVRAGRAARVPDRLVVADLRRLHRGVLRARPRRLARRVHHERLVAAHARVRTAAEHAGSWCSRSSEAAIGLGLLALVISYLPTIYGVVLAPRGRGHRPLGPRGHAADAVGDARARAPRRATCTSMDRVWESG